MTTKTKPLWLRITLWILAFALVIGGVFGFSVVRASCKKSDLENTILDFSVTDGQGEEVRLSDYRGKPVVVNFWAIWCPPCRQELPDFQRAYEKYDGEAVFLFVNLLRWQGDSEEDVKAFMKENGYTFPVYYDVLRKAEKACSVSSIPLTLFIGKDGRVKKTYSAAIPFFLLENYIKDIL